MSGMPGMPAMPPPISTMPQMQQPQPPMPGMPPHSPPTVCVHPSSPTGGENSMWMSPQAQIAAAMQAPSSPKPEQLASSQYWMPPHMVSPTRPPSQPGSPIPGLEPQYWMPPQQHAPTRPASAQPQTTSISERSRAMYMSESLRQAVAAKQGFASRAVSRASSPPPMAPPQHVMPQPMHLPQPPLHSPVPQHTSLPVPGIHNTSQHSTTQIIQQTSQQTTTGPVPSLNSSLYGSMSQSCTMLMMRLRSFMDQQIIPSHEAFKQHAESAQRWQPFPQMEPLKAAARSLNLWNLWVTPELASSFESILVGVSPAEANLLRGPQLSNVDYAHLAKIMGEIPWAAEVFNCSAPDTGNMEVLARFGSSSQQRKWLLPLLRGDIRSCFAMTEPQVASSDARNVQGLIQKEGQSFVVNARKCWISGACDSRCKIAIFMGKSDPSGPQYRQQSMVLIPMDSPGVKVTRPMTVFGADDAPHGHADMVFANVRVGMEDIVLGEGRGFEIAQGRLGPGRLHHCMRACGIGEAALKLVAKRVQQRHAFGSELSGSPLVQAQLADAWLQLHTAWLAVLHAASQLDSVGSKPARQAITAAKVVVPKAILDVVDRAIQLHGAAGVGQDTDLAALYGAVRTLRLADGPDEVHLMSLGRHVINQYSTQSKL